MNECKACASCRVEKATSEFHRSKRRKDGFEPYCKACRSAMRRGEDPRMPDPHRPVAGPGERVCGRCVMAKPVSDFPPSKRTADGLYPYCRDCKRAAQREDHARHKPARNASMRAQYERDKDAYKARARAQYAADPEQWKRNVREWALANPERRQEIVRSSARRRYALDPEVKREAWRRRQAAVRRGCRTYPFTTEQLAAKVAYWGGKCWMCSAPYQAIDHVKPLAKGGPHLLANLRPACTACNTRKRDRWPFLAA